MRQGEGGRLRNAVMSSAYTQRRAGPTGALTLPAQLAHAAVERLPSSRCEYLTHFSLPPPPPPTPRLGFSASSVCSPPSPSPSFPPACPDVAVRRPRPRIPPAGHFSA